MVWLGVGLTCYVVLWRAKRDRSRWSDRANFVRRSVGPGPRDRHHPCKFISFCHRLVPHLTPLTLGFSNLQLVLYQGSQVVAGQLTVAILKAWARRVKVRNERLLMEEKQDMTPGSEEKTGEVLGSEGGEGKTETLVGDEEKGTSGDVEKKRVGV